MTCSASMCCCQRTWYHVLLSMTNLLQLAVWNLWCLCISAHHQKNALYLCSPSALYPCILKHILLPDTYSISSIRLLFLLLFVLVWLVFKGGLYFVGKLVDSNGGWNKYMWAIQIGTIGADSSTHRLLVLLSAMETSLKTWAGLEIAQWASVVIISIGVCAPHIVAAATIWRRRLIKEIAVKCW